MVLTNRLLTGRRVWYPPVFMPVILELNDDVLPAWFHEIEKFPRAARGIDPEEAFYRYAFQDDELLEVFRRWCSSWVEKKSQPGVRTAAQKELDTYVRNQGNPDMTSRLLDQRLNLWARIGAEIREVSDVECFRLYRGYREQSGVASAPQPSPFQIVKYIWQRASLPTDPCVVERNGLSSWSFWKSTAEGFTKNESGKHYGVVVQADIPVYQVLADFFSNDAALKEKYRPLREAIVVTRSEGTSLPGYLVEAGNIFAYKDDKVYDFRTREEFLAS